MCSFVFSTNSSFKVKELLKIGKPLPLPLAIICDLLKKKKKIQESGQLRETQVYQYFFNDSYNLLETKNNQVFAIYILKCDFDGK